MKYILFEGLLQVRAQKQLKSSVTSNQRLATDAKFAKKEVFCKTQLAI